MSSTTAKVTLWVSAAILFAGVGTTSYLYLQKEPATPVPAPLANSQPAATQQAKELLPEFQLMDVDEKPQSIKQWQGKVVVLNFWATWCPPCRRELPTFKALQDEYGERGVQFVGVSLDRGELVKDYARIEALNYPQLVGPSKALELGQQLGNRMGALPFTVVVDRKGYIAERIFGEWSREEAETTFKKLL